MTLQWLIQEIGEQGAGSSNAGSSLESVLSGVLSLFLIPWWWSALVSDLAVVSKR